MKIRNPKWVLGRKETLRSAVGAAALVLAGAGLAIAQNGQPPAKADQPPSGIIALLPPAISRERLTAKDKFQIYAHRSFGPQNFILPAAGAAFFMLNPPRDYPREWKDGGGALGRWYGEQIAASTANRTAQVLAEVALHEDPRYVPSTANHALARTLHAIVFTLVDKTDAGRNTLALSNLAGAAAGGFSGMALLPPGHKSALQAEQRALRGLGSVAIRNVIAEFRPQWEPVLRKVRVPRILPEWWTHRPTVVMASPRIP